MTKVYSQAFTEVYEILSYLDENNYKKIPNDIITALYENMDKDYKFFIDDSIPLYKQHLLEETKALLFNLYRDYLSDSEIRKKVIEYQKAKEFELEKLKRKKYDPNNIFKKNNSKTLYDEKILESKHLKQYNESTIKKVFYKILKILHIRK